MITQLDKRHLERLTPKNSAMLLIDHQTGTMLGVQDIRLDQFGSNVLALAKTARANNLPTVLTASFPDGPNGPLMPELVEMFPESTVIARPGMISAWDDPRFVQAVEKTGRKKLIMAGVTTDVCLMFPVQQALAAGYEVYAVYDASGCWDMMSELASILALESDGSGGLQLGRDLRRSAERLAEQPTANAPNFRRPSPFLRAACKQPKLHQKCFRESRGQDAVSVSQYFINALMADNGDIKGSVSLSSVQTEFGDECEVLCQHGEPGPSSPTDKGNSL